jgi:hypothetical protein
VSASGRRRCRRSGSRCWAPQGRARRGWTRGSGGSRGRPRRRTVCARTGTPGSRPVESRDRASVGELRHAHTGLDVVDAPAVPIVGAAEDEAECLLGAEAVGVGAVELVDVAAPLEVRVAPLRSERPGLLVPRGLRDEVDRAADGVTVLVGRQRLVQLDRPDEVRGDGVQLELAAVALGGRDVAPLMAPFVYLGSSPRTWTYFPSPSSRSRETLGRRPMASATLVLGRLVITSAGSTSTMFWADFCWLRAETSPARRHCFDVLAMAARRDRHVPDSPTAWMSSGSGDAGRQVAHSSPARRRRAAGRGPPRATRRNHRGRASERALRAPAPRRGSP